MSCSSSVILPVSRVPSIRSFMRFSVRRNVDLPQPDGPISAVTWRSGNVMLMSFKRMEVAVVEVDVFGLHLRRICRRGLVLSRSRRPATFANPVLGGHW